MTTWPCQYTLLAPDRAKGYDGGFEHLFEMLRNLGKDTVCIPPKGFWFAPPIPISNTLLSVLNIIENSKKCKFQKSFN